MPRLINLRRRLPLGRLPAERPSCSNCRAARTSACRGRSEARESMTLLPCCHPTCVVARLVAAVLTLLNALWEPAMAHHESSRRRVRSPSTACAPPWVSSKDD